MSEEPSDSAWPCSWEEHELMELREGKRMSLREKLEWLEGAAEFVRRLEEGRRCSGREEGGRERAEGGE
jgi:hypothetical protein